MPHIVICCYCIILFMWCNRWASLLSECVIIVGLLCLQLHQQIAAGTRKADSLFRLHAQQAHTRHAGRYTYDMWKSLIETPMWKYAENVMHVVGVFVECVAVYEQVKMISIAMRVTPYSSSAKDPNGLRWNAILTFRKTIKWRSRISSTSREWNLESSALWITLCERAVYNYASQLKQWSIAVER